MSTPRPLKLTPPEPSEAALQAALMRRLRLRGWLCVRVNGGGFKTPRGFFWAYIIQGLNASKGFPDVLALKGSRFRLIEVKCAGGKLRPEQIAFRDFARRHCVEVEIVEGLAGLNALKP